MEYSSAHFSHTAVPNTHLHPHARSCPNLAVIFYSSLTAGNSRRDHGNHGPAETSTCPEQLWHSSQQGRQVTGTRSCAFMQMAFWLCQHTLWNTLPRVRCICNEVWEWCPICILNRPTDTAVHAVHAVSAAERAQHNRTQPDRPCLLFHYQIGLLGLCHPFTRKLPNRCVAKQHRNVKCVSGSL